jgi:hypothetical protein
MRDNIVSSSRQLTNLYWHGDVWATELPSRSVNDLLNFLPGLEGQYAFAVPIQDQIALVRDKHGVNKLFFAVREDGVVIVANYIIDLLSQDIPFEAVYSVPSGHATIVCPGSRQLYTHRYYTADKHEAQSVGDAARTIRRSIEQSFQRLARDMDGREIYVCLSGGLDSSLIAALACKYFRNVVAYTYSFVSETGQLTEDAEYAARVADHLQIQWCLVRATGEDIREALDAALVYGQDWREFNVHCAIVNVILAKAMAADARASGRSRGPLVLTGDMMNEILVDYTPIRFRDKDYYVLPTLEPGDLRRVLIRGLDAGDREVGVFGRYDLDLLQPYGLVLDQYLAVPQAVLGSNGGKQQLVQEIAGDLLPSFLLGRQKVRAQIGNSAEPAGILPYFIDQGWNQPWLKKTLANRFGLADEQNLDRFIRGGMYRWSSRFPNSRKVCNGFFAE